MYIACYSPRAVGKKPEKVFEALVAVIEVHPHGNTEHGNQLEQWLTAGATITATAVAADRVRTLARLLKRTEGRLGGCPVGQVCGHERQKAGDVDRGGS